MAIKKNKINPSSKHTFAITNPGAAFLIWNYDDRLGDTKSTNPHNVNKKIISTASLVSISTSKTKGSPVGSFTVTLAPTRNWQAEIVAGSWCAILMSDDLITKDDIDKAKQKTLRMVGRVESVKMDLQVDQGGARNTVYTVTGSDWGHVFTNVFFIDPIAYSSVMGNSVAISLLNRTTHDGGKLSILSSRVMLETLKEIWGTPLFSEIQKDISNNAKTDFLIQPTVNFELPNDVSAFLGMINDSDSAAVRAKTESSGGRNKNNQRLKSMISSIKLITGQLKGYDSYDDDPITHGYIRTGALVGNFAMWQLMSDHCGDSINELFCDLGWKNDRPFFGLWNRMMPFSNRRKGISDYSSDNQIVESDKLDPTDKAEVDRLRSLTLFRNIKRTEIPLEKIISISTETNWRDKHNMLQLYPGINGPGAAESSTIAFLKARQVDVTAFSREGLRPLMLTTKLFPLIKDSSTGSEVPNPLGTSIWTYLLRDWFFNTHRMLNGMITFSGINDYIGVGQNIIVHGSALGIEQNTSSFQAKNKNDAYFLAHVEGINHSFTVREDGARHYITTVTFVRGIITNIEGKPLDNKSTESTLLDRYSSKVLSDSKNNTVIAVSTENDPDSQKLVGRTRRDVKK